MNRGMTTEDDFHRALDANPDDWQCRLVFADWLEERGDVRAEGYRALGAQRLHSVRGAEWYLGTAAPPHPAATVIEEYGPCRLPADWFAALTAGRAIVSGPNHDVAWRRFDSRRQAEDDAAVAFMKLPAERRAELLAPAPNG